MDGLLQKATKNYAMASANLGTHTTVFQAEIMAIINACHNLLELHIQKPSSIKQIHIFSDSKSGIQSLSKEHTESSLVLECKRIINILIKNNYYIK